MRAIQKTEKVPDQHHTYRRVGCGPINTKRFGGCKFALLQHKNKPRVVLFTGDNTRQFRTLQVISPSEARKLIGWLARYIAISDPDPISLAIASTKAHASEICREQVKIAKELGIK